MKKFIKGFQYAAEGLLYAFRTQTNMKVHLLIAIVVIIFGIILKISSTEWLFISFAIILVLIAELFNTAIETLTDLTTKEIHPLAKITKDTAAAAVLLTSMLAIIIGVYVFWKYIF